MTSFFPPSAPEGSGCDSCDCHLATIPSGHTLYHVSAATTMLPSPFTREGCYSYAADRTPVFKMACPSCISGQCQARGYDIYHPAFTYTEGCWMWHGGSGEAQSSASQPSLIGTFCDCGGASGLVLPPPPPPSPIECGPCDCHGPAPPGYSLYNISDGEAYSSYEVAFTGVAESALTSTPRLLEAGSICFVFPRLEPACSGGLL